MKKTLITLVVLLMTQLAYSQYNETIRSARPGQAVGPFTTGKNVFQIQTGLTYSEYKVDGANSKGSNVEYTNSMRYGLAEKFEIRTAFKLRSDDNINEDNSSSKYGGLNFWNVGVRYNILSGTGYQPSLGVQVDTKLTWVDKDYKTDELQPRVMLIYGQKLSDIFRLTTNLAVLLNQPNIDHKETYVLNLSFPLGKKLGGFVENYGELVDGDIDTRWDTGLSYLVNNDFLLDISAGYGKNDSVSDWFIDGGISWRIKFK